MGAIFIHSEIKLPSPSLSGKLLDVGTTTPPPPPPFFFNGIPYHIVTDCLPALYMTLDCFSSLSACLILIPIFALKTGHTPGEGFAFGKVKKQRGERKEKGGDRSRKGGHRSSKSG